MKKERKQLLVIKRLVEDKKISSYEAKFLMAGSFEKDRKIEHEKEKTILVTGGAGFIGSNFIHYIFESYENVKIINFDALTYAGNLENLKKVEKDSRYKFIKGNLKNKSDIDNAFKQNKIDLIVHFAAESHVDRSIHEPNEFLKSNVIGTNNLLRAAVDFGKIHFHHVSTDEVFGSLEKEDPEFDEKTPYDPRSPYSASKASSDHVVRAYYHTYNLPITISNCSNNYGPYMFPEKFIPLMITNLLENKKIPLYGDGLNIRDWLHVKDHCRAIDAISSKGGVGETYAVGGDYEKTNKEICKIVLKMMKKNEDMIEYVKDRPGHDKRYAIDSSKLRNELSWRPLVDFEQGIKSMIKWYQNNQAWWKKIKSGKYLDYYEKQYGK